MNKMNGSQTRFYRYEKTVPRISIPRPLADSLNWKHKDELTIVIKTIDGATGLFIFKKEKSK